MYILSTIFVVVSVVFYFLVRRKNILQCLVRFCAEAEMAYGSGTGYLKLRDVYAEFVKAYPVISVIMPFDYFAYLVDTALIALNEKIEENDAICDIVVG